MQYQEPGSIEIFITRLAGNLFGGVYKEYVDRMDLNGDERVLELGPSAGNVTRHLARRLSMGGRITCVDISRTWIEVAHKRLRSFSNIDYKIGEIDRVGIPPASQDVIVLSFVLHEIPAASQPSTVTGLVKTLRPGGRVYLREPLRYISRKSIQDLMVQCGLIEINSMITEIKTQGSVFEAIYCRG